MESAAHSTTDLMLLERWQDGCAVSGTQLVERYLALLYRFFRNKVDVSLEDLVQETLLAVLEARGRFRGHASFRTFMLAIARNKLLDHYSRQRKGRVDSADMSVRDLGTTPTGAIARGQQERMLIASLQEMPIDAQMVLELVYWENLSVQEVSQVLEVPANTVYSRLRRARATLREKLSDLGNEAMPARLSVDLEFNKTASER